MFVRLTILVDPKPGTDATRLLRQRYEDIKAVLPLGSRVNDPARLLPKNFWFELGDGGIYAVTERENLDALSLPPAFKHDLKSQDFFLTIKAPKRLPIGVHRPPGRDARTWVVFQWKHGESGTTIEVAAATFDKLIELAKAAVAGELEVIPPKKK